MSESKPYEKLKLIRTVFSLGSIEILPLAHFFDSIQDPNNLSAQELTSLKTILNNGPLMLKLQEMASQPEIYGAVCVEHCQDIMGYLNRMVET
jgi:hypothetical protein